MKPRLQSIRVRLFLGAGLLFLALAVIQAAVLQRQSAEAMRAAAQQRQATSLRILIDQFASEFDGIDLETGPGGRVERASWAALPELTDHAIIDRVAALSGETATLFAWDAARDDFVRVTTNIRKPDGARAVGTVLGRDNPVHAAMIRGETFTGEATILGKPYLTIYEPIIGPAGKAIGIFYVGIDRSQIDAAIAAARYTSLVLSGLLIATALGALLLMLRAMLRPLSDLGASFERMAGGDLDAPVPHAGRPDEIGAIASRADSFRQELAEAHRRDADAARRRDEEDARVVKTLTAGLKRLAEGDLTQKLEDWLPEAYKGLRMDFNATIDSLNMLIGSVIENALEIRRNADAITASSEELSHRTENQAATLEETAAAMDELTNSVKSTAASAAEVESVVQSAHKDAEQSSRVVGDAVGAMSDIKKSSDEISQIIGVIDDIAFQTNLLALNAGVEAARAGEAGRGFAVVASEVRGLAQRSSEAANEIKTLISGASERVDSGVSLVNRAGDALTDILGRVSEITGLVGGIATSAQEQSVGLGEINVGVTQLDQVTQQNAAMVEEMAAGAATLNAESASLEQLVARFRTRENGAMPLAAGGATAA
ncbi:MAG: methyl-accepting chemotaxis protein [Rhodovulum sp.]